MMVLPSGVVYCVDKKIFKEYTIEATIQNKMRLYTTKETLGYKGRKTYVAATEEPAKREENQRGTSGETNPQTNNKQVPE